MSSLVHHRRTAKLNAWLDFLGASHNVDMPVMEFFADLSGQLDHLGRGLADLHFTLSSNWKPGTHKTISLSQMGKPVVEINIDGSDDNKVSIKRKGRQFRKHDFALPDQGVEAANMVIEQLIAPIHESDLLRVFSRVVEAPVILDHATLKEYDMRNAKAGVLQRGLGVDRPVHRSFAR